ncbi:sensor histidine kinase [Phocaeicola sp.]
MKIPFRAIAALIILSLIGVFAYQTFWLTGLYTTMKKEMDNCLQETLQISDYNEMMLRCDSLRKYNMEKKEFGTNYNIDSLTMKDTQSLLFINEPFSITIDKNGSVELLTKYFQRGIHSQLDLFTNINLHTFDSIFTRAIAMRGIAYLPHRIEIIDLREDSTAVCGVSNPVNYMPGKKAAFYYYNYDRHNKMAYRLCVEPTRRVVLHQMTGILGTSFLIIVILGLSFWYLIRIILRQKTVEEMKEDFTHNITHELKTPIAVAYAANDSLLNFNGAEKLEKRHTYLQIIQEQLKQLSGLVEQILSMSMEQRKNFRLSYEDIELKPMLESLIGQHRLKADKPVEFRLAAEKDIVVRADRTHLYNVVSNLIDNAVKYSGEKAEIYIQAFYSDQCLTLKVSDKGIGIPADKQRHLFDKFYRVPTGNLHNVKGYGLGLYYVKTMVEQHKGTVSVESVAGKGSTFILQIPG